MSSRRRVFRVAEQVRNIVATALTRVADPRLAMVTITSVVISSDLRHAKVYWMVSGDNARRDEVAQGFERAGGHFRRLIAQGLGVRFVPEVKFFYDDTFDTRDEVDRLLDRARMASQGSEEGEEKVDGDG